VNVYESGMQETWRGASHTLLHRGQMSLLRSDHNKKGNRKGYNQRKYYRGVVMESEFIPASEIVVKEKTILMRITPREELMIEHLKPFAKTKARTKVLKFALENTYNSLKNVKP
jgi:hypothetical protein